MRLSCLEAGSREFRFKWKGEREGRSREGEEITETEIEEEKKRRREIMTLRGELYGIRGGKMEGDPEWDDVVPVPQEEPEGALAGIAYPAEYAEAISYLRAVMSKKEYSPRCLRLTETIINLNPAYYTVWLYRASIIFAMKLSIPDEIKWLNQVALEHLKNYQIWHHRHLLVDNYFPTISHDHTAIANFAASEREFLQLMLSEDTKNYHVWSYRSYLVEKAGIWDVPEELQDMDRMIADDVRNNSAWSHRFFLLFSNPKHSTPGIAATEHDPATPSTLVDREVAYAKEKIALAPQNQSPWNYLRGVLVKGGRKLGSVEDFVEGFVKGLGTDDEDVKSSHALDLLAEIYAEKGEKDKADLCLRRLGEKWDQIRAGYWEWRRKCLE